MPQSCGDAQAVEVLDEFLAEHRAEAEAALKADNALSEAEKQLEGERCIPVPSLLSFPPHPFPGPPGTRDTLCYSWGTSDSVPSVPLGTVHGIPTYFGNPMPSGT